MHPPAAITEASPPAPPPGPERTSRPEPEPAGTAREPEPRPPSGAGPDRSVVATSGRATGFPRTGPSADAPDSSTRVAEAEAEDRPVGRTEREERTERDDGPPVGPPADAATSYEDLPGDLFGEEDRGPAGPDERAPAPDADDTPAEAAREGRRASGARRTSRSGETRGESRSPRGPARSTSGGGSGGEARGKGGPAGPAEEVDTDDVLDAVGRLFPGRIVALEPLPDETGSDGGAEDGGVAPPEGAEGTIDDD